MFGMAWIRGAALVGLATLQAAEDPEVRVPEAKAKADILIALPGYVEWPREWGVEDRSKPFRIGILGPSSLEAHLHASAASRTIRGKPVEIRLARRVQELGDCHMVFIRDLDADRLPEILHQLKGRAVLTVGDSPTYASDGVMVNLVNVRKRIGLEVNLGVLRGNGLQASSQLLRLARIVE